MREKGIVLVIILVLIGSIAFIVSFLNLKTRALFQALSLDQTERIAEDVVDDLVQNLIKILLNYQKEVGQIPDKITFKYNDRKYKVLISDESELYNINSNDREELYNLFAEELHLPPEKALIMTDSLLDWIDGDHDSLEYGAEDKFYSSKNYSPPNRPVKSFFELLLVRGFDPYTFWVEPRIFDYITIFANSNKDKEAKKSEERKLKLENGGIYRIKILAKEGGLKYTIIIKLVGHKTTKLFLTSL